MAEKMICLRCGARMNFHAEKLIYLESASQADETIGQVQEMHCCPNCGHSDSRLQS